MTDKFTTIGLGSLAMVALFATPQASAQTAAVADPQAALLQSAAFTNAMTQIRATYKTQLDQAEALRKELAPLEQPFDADRNGNIDDQELAKMRASPNWATIQAKEQQAANAELPALRARAYVIEQLGPRLNTAFKNVITAKRISMVVRPEAVLTADDTANITDDVTAEMNKVTTPVSTTPPANWQPGQQQGAAAPAPTTPAPTGTTPAPTTTPRRPR